MACSIVSGAVGAISGALVDAAGFGACAAAGNARTRAEASMTRGRARGSDRVMSRR
ncbi:hypothetical protein GCM10027400_13910 [Pseudoxanthomonas daejeonensis]